MGIENVILLPSLSVAVTQATLKNKRPCAIACRQGPVGIPVHCKFLKGQCQVTAGFDVDTALVRISRITDIDAILRIDSDTVFIRTADYRRLRNQCINQLTRIDIARNVRTT